MKIYFAGPMTQKQESDVSKLVLDRYPVYRRLFSFFYERECSTSIEQMYNDKLIDEKLKTKE
jgi:hypothetical protein